MHSIYGITIIYIISNVLPLISSAPIPDELSHKLIYDLLVDYSTSKCPYLKTTKLLDPKSSFLSQCSSYSSLKSMKSFTHQTQSDLLCILYTNNYLRLCDSLGNNSKVINDTVIDGIAKSYNLSNTCQGLSESKLNDDFKDVGSVLSKFEKPDVCNALCKELLDDSVIPVCNLAAVTSSIAERFQIGPVKPQTLQGSQKNILKVEQVKGNHVVNHDVSSIRTKTGVIQDSPPVNNIKNVENKVLPVKKPEVSLTDVHSQEVESSNVEYGGKSVALHPNVQILQAHIDNVVKAGDDTSVKENKASAADVEKPEIQAENPVAVIPNVKTPGDKQENQHEEQQEKAIQTPSDTQQKSSAEQVQKDQKELITTSTEGIPAMKDDKSMENHLGEDFNEMRDTNQSNDQLNIEEDVDEDTVQQEPQKPVDKVKPQAKPQETDEDVLNPQFNSNSDEEDSFFFIYFMMVCAVFILGYIGYHNKQKVLALVIEGRRGRRGSRRGRPNSANYHKLDSNLEEAVTSSCTKNTTSIIY